jgi:hypothetical protein
VYCGDGPPQPPVRGQLRQILPLCDQPVIGVKPKKQLPLSHTSVTGDSAREFVVSSFGCRRLNLDCCVAPWTQLPVRLDTAAWHPGHRCLAL